MLRYFIVRDIGPSNDPDIICWRHSIAPTNQEHKYTIPANTGPGTLENTFFPCAGRLRCASQKAPLDLTRGGKQDKQDYGDCQKTTGSLREAGMAAGRRHEDCRKATGRRRGVQMRLFKTRYLDPANIYGPGTGRKTRQRRLRQDFRLQKTHVVDSARAESTGGTYGMTEPAK